MSSERPRRAAPVVLSTVQEYPMKRSVLFGALLLAAGASHAADGFNLGVGVDYSSGDYGTETTTKILSVPVTAKYTAGAWTYKASLPWVRAEARHHVRVALDAQPR